MRRNRRNLFVTVFAFLGHVLKNGFTLTICLRNREAISMIVSEIALILNNIIKPKFYLVASQYLARIIIIVHKLPENSIF